MSNRHTEKRAGIATKRRATVCHDRGLTAREKAMLDYLENWLAERTATEAGQKVRAAAKRKKHDKNDA